MSVAQHFVGADAPVALETLLEQLQLAAVEVLGRGARAAIDGPAQPNAPWTGRVLARAQQIQGSGEGPLSAALELARQVLRDPRANGIESLELRRLLTEGVR